MSLWEQYRSGISFPSLKENLIVNTLIIGGGMTGVNTLYFLKNQEDVCLVEASLLCSSVSKNTTGKINYLQENTLLSLWQEGKNDQAISYLDSQLYGMNLLIQIIHDENISCDLEKVSSFLVTNEKKNVSILKQFKSFLEEHQISVTEDIDLISESFLYGIGVLNTYVFNPMKYLEGLAKKIGSKRIYEHTKIIKVVSGESYYYCYTDSGYCIRAKQVVMACHYPFFLFPFFLPLKSQIEKSYLVARKVPKNLKYTYITMESPSLSSRFYDDGKQVYQIVLGSSHDISTKQDDYKNFQKVLKDFDISSSLALFSWSNVDLITLDHLAYIGEIKANIYLSSAYQTWGMIGSILGAKIICDKILHQKNDYAFLFEPKRKSVKKMLQLGCSIGVNTKSFLMSHYYPKSWYNSDLKFTFHKGKIIAIFTDSSGEHKVHPICPHMKCGLIFNAVEKTWDCPCHSSRFDKDGNCIKGPSKYSIHYDS